MAAANFEVMSSTSSGSSSSDEHDEAANFGGKTRLDFSHRELDSDMLEIHLAGLAEVPGRYYFLKKQSFLPIKLFAEWSGLEKF